MRTIVVWYACATI